MNLKDFKKEIQQSKNGFLNRCKLINRLMSIDKDWSYALRTLLFCSNTRIIANWYVIQKIDYMIENPDKIADFMDYTRKRIYQLLAVYLRKK